MSTEKLKILFLDVDGVLNAHDYDPEVGCGCIYPDKMTLLNGVLRATGAKVVLSSAWRYIVHRGEATLAGMDWLLRSHGLLAGRLVGITRPDTMRESPNYTGVPSSWPVCDERGWQISDWLRDNPADAYAVVDDLDLGITAAGHPLVRTDGAVGMTKHDARRLVEILNREPKEQS